MLFTVYKHVRVQQSLAYFSALELALVVFLFIRFPVGQSLNVLARVQSKPLYHMIRDSLLKHSSYSLDIHVYSFLGKFCRFESRLSISD